MRLSLLFGVSALLTVQSGTRAQAPNRPPANPILTVLQLDANGDRTLERDEVPDTGREALDRLLKLGDQNKNGRLEADELRELVGKVQALAAQGAERFKAMDKDGDGKVSKEEFTGPKPLFGPIDRDANGFLTQEEMRAFGAAGGPARFERLRALDKDGDGKISQDEFTGPKPRFARLDVDGNGFLTLEEFLKAPEPPAAPDAAPRPPRLRLLDKDGDGRVSRQEFNGPARLFERLDANKDGYLSIDDLWKQGTP
jgi:Ca2+-binding EF-hand superfamily protein